MTGSATARERVLWIDAGNGAAGDMLLAALLDAGADADTVRAGLSRLRVEPVELGVQPVRRRGFRATYVTVDASESHVHRGLPDVTAVIRAAELPEPVTRFACEAFTRLGEAEARVHGVTVDRVHFHEVGALDAIADVVGCALALHDLGLLAQQSQQNQALVNAVVSPVAVGSGVVRGAHGRMTVPPPAVLELLTGAAAPLAAHPAEMELCTPTGAALLTTLAARWGPPPECTPRAIGVGAGTADPDSHPNLLRVLLGESSAAGAGHWREESLYQVETTVDDMDPRIWPDLLERLRSSGAVDAWTTPALMRKGRPGQVLTALVPPGEVDRICREVFEHTPSLGVRVQQLTRRALERDRIEVPVAGGTVRVKRGFVADRVVTVQPEYADAAELAERTGTPVADVIAAARQAAGTAGDQG
ncbi:nickel pincer cofactor biosynthesis protein LarC [Haloechinothrix sp. LS1_15]|uniref:nickel pincer cofactor biosynthesis protein LarC n=1 Tax=Haloechinothrix sp. LS1_15 TaxID=2652248 RepID=UPI0029443F4B|nr:nickel pincer cofactor biosynthesis protein LarC [Haloechinothrix sp. LS1_15]MDV6010917.1 nickel pincer cofactor biosynthesis protein LarC [Haloechinothrix sp. LS1_15]